MELMCISKNPFAFVAKSNANQWDENKQVELYFRYWIERQGKYAFSCDINILEEKTDHKFISSHREKIRSIR